MYKSNKLCIGMFCPKWQIIVIFLDQSMRCESGILPKIKITMIEQNYANHRRLVKGYHLILTILLLSGIIISIINVARHPPNSGGHVSSALIALLFICLFFIIWFMRAFPLKAQDRAIRAEEALRYFILTGKSLDRRLTIGQITALRFASDEEFLPLVDRSLTENLSSKDIKQAIKNWRADNHRV
jgi:hypothetical protein